jgi:hypothetical protein
MTRQNEIVFAARSYFDTYDRFLTGCVLTGLTGYKLFFAVCFSLAHLCKVKANNWAGVYLLLQEVHQRTRGKPPLPAPLQVVLVAPPGLPLPLLLGGGSGHPPPRPPVEPPPSVLAVPLGGLQPGPAPHPPQPPAVAHGRTQEAEHLCDHFPRQPHVVGLWGGGGLPFPTQHRHAGGWQAGGGAARGGSKPELEVALELEPDPLLELEVEEDPVPSREEDRDEEAEEVEEQK